MPMNLNEVKDLIEAALPESQVAVRDLVGDGDHLEAIIVSDLFDGKSLLQQHQMVMAPLNEALKGQLHALKIQTYTPDQWESKQKS